jgi:SAM-dependent methyltransferase
MASNDLAALLRVDRFPRASAYDPSWVIENLMGPNVLWLAEFLSQAMDLRPGMRVLDMGCGKAVSSIFFAREFDVQVWATDLWISASENQRRLEDAGVADRVFPVHAEAHALPFAHGFFDAAVSLDAYHYFGTDDLYLGYYSRFLKPEAEIGIVVPGLRAEIGEDIPTYLRPYWHWDFCSFHSPDWWRAHWQKTGLVDLATSDLMPDGWNLWLRWLDVCAQEGGPGSEQEAEMLRTDNGRNLGFVRVVARRRAEPIYLA